MYVQKTHLVPFRHARPNGRAALQARASQLTRPPHRALTALRRSYVRMRPATWRQAGRPRRRVHLPRARLRPAPVRREGWPLGMFCSGVAVLSVMSVFALLLWLPWGTLAAANCPALPSCPALPCPASPCCHASLSVCLSAAAGRREDDASHLLVAPPPGPAPGHENLEVGHGHAVLPRKLFLRPGRAKAAVEAVISEPFPPQEPCRISIRHPRSERSPLGPEWPTGGGRISRSARGPLPRGHL